MAQIDCFYVVSKNNGDDLMCEVMTLDSAMTEIGLLSTQREMHQYFPLSVILEDTDGRETRILTVQLDNTSVR